MESINEEIQDENPVRYLKSSSTDVTNIDRSLYAESQSALYDGYQQAWRLLGFYVDCKNSNVAPSSSSDALVCTRYLVWAAYVDMDYSGGGIGEYIFYNTEKESYDSKLTCSTTHGSSSTTTSSGTRCVKMDCHEPDKTHWKLLGVFKQEHYSTKYLTQLFKHSGSCLWNNNGDAIQFMQNSLQSWPEYTVNYNNNNNNNNDDGTSSIATCVVTTYKADDGTKLYIDLKPSYGAYMTLAFYSDSNCKTEHEPPGGDYSKLQHAASDNGFLYGNYLQTWNANMNSFKYCQPCMTYNLLDPNGYYANNINYPPYSCTDSNGNTNINQCSKFRSNTDMTPMTLSDIEIADQQGGILQVNINGHKYGTPIASLSTSGIYKDHPYYRSSSQQAQQQKAAYPLLITSVVLLITSIISLALMIRWKSKREATRERQIALQEQLVTDITDESESHKLT